jgi:hypothetical protein
VICPGGPIFLVSRARTVDEKIPSSIVPATPVNF